MQSSRLLFLGASLKTDRTLDMVKKSIVPNIPNFAIVGVNSYEELELKKIELDALNIAAIYYPINSTRGHSWVKAILQWLKDKFSPTEEEINNIISRDRYYRFGYDLMYVPYSDVGKYQHQLTPFLDSAKRFSWWEVTSASGGGKSRLSLELKGRAEEKGWTVKLYDDSNYEDVFLAFDESPSLYIFDDAEFYLGSRSEKNKQEFLDGFISWIRVLVEGSRRGKRNRVLFVYTTVDGSATQRANSR